MFILFHQLPLLQLFAVVFLISLAICWLLIGTVRAGVRMAGFSPTEMLPIRDSIIGACTTVFALIVAFTAAGIWNDALNARNAVQREADALENASVLVAGLPTEVQTAIRNDIRAYVTSVITIDWPEMAKGGTIEDPVFDHSGKILVDMIERLSSQQVSLGQLATFVPLQNQLLETRHARLARLAASNAGTTWAQWIAMFIISTSALTAITICNTHSLRMQVVATHLYVLVASAAYFVILAHDRPFIGAISVKPLAFQSLIEK